MSWTQPETEKVDKILSAVTTLGATVTEYAKHIDRHDVDLQGRPGNGRNPGLLTRMMTAEIVIGNVQRKYRRVVAGVWALVLTSMGAALAMLGEYLLR